MLLQLENVSKSYPMADGPAALSILKGISLAVSAGDAIGIMGPSGSGKSTLLNIMGTLDRPSAGTGGWNSWRKIGWNYWFPRAACTRRWPRCGRPTPTKSRPLT